MRSIPASLVVGFMLAALPLSASASPIKPDFKPKSLIELEGQSRAPYKMPDQFSTSSAPYTPTQHSVSMASLMYEALLTLDPGLDMLRADDLNLNSLPYEFEVRAILVAQFQLEFFGRVFSQGSEEEALFLNFINEENDDLANGYFTKLVDAYRKHPMVVEFNRADFDDYTQDVLDKFGVSLLPHEHQVLANKLEARRDDLEIILARSMLILAMGGKEAVPDFRESVFSVFGLYGEVLQEMHILNSQFELYNLDLIVPPEFSEPTND